MDKEYARFQEWHELEANILETERKLFVLRGRRREIEKDYATWSRTQQRYWTERINKSLGVTHQQPSTTDSYQCSPPVAETLAPI